MTPSQSDSFCLRGKCFYDPRHDIKVSVDFGDNEETMFFAKTKLGFKRTDMWICSNKPI